MKTAVSIPDRLYDAAERLARELGLSRSALYARALERFVEERGSTRVTAALNEVYGKEPEVDEFLERAGELALEDEGW